MSTEDFEAYTENQEDARFSEWIRNRLDRYGPELAPQRRTRLDELFRRTVDLEVAFFDMAYES